MDSHKSRTQALNYFQQSPVRGQLEPADGTTGDRRFLQCTDIPNEFKVLLPARTSVLYGSLLKVELDELRRGSSAHWDRIKEIRHLKERMLRKCERLARVSLPEKRPGQMVALHAPPEFRLREMEKWLKELNQSVVQPPTGYSCCSMCGPLGVHTSTVNPSAKRVARSATVVATRTSIVSRDSPVPSRSNSLRSGHPHTAPSISRTASSRTAPTSIKHAAITKRSSASSLQTLVEPESEPRYYIAKHGSVQQVSLVKSRVPSDKILAMPLVIRPPEPAPKPIPHRIRDKRDARPSHASRVEDPPRAIMQSPDPLPIPYRPRVHHEETNNTAVAHEAEHGAIVEASATATSVAPPPAACSSPKVLPGEAQKAPVPAKTPQSADGREPTSAPTTGVPLETIHEKPGEHEDEDVAAQHPLMRRRSSLKKGSMHSLASQTKSVTWAMDRDWTKQMSRFVKVSNEADVAAYDLDQSRSQYHEEIAMMRIVCQDAVKAAEKLGLNTDELKHEETALALQQHKIATISELIEEREARYRDAVFAVSEETKQIVQLCDKKRETHEDY